MATRPYTEERRTLDNTRKNIPKYASYITLKEKRTIYQSIR